MNQYFIVKDNKIFGNPSSGGQYFDIVSTTPAFSVSGGTVTTSGIYTLHTFTGSGTLTVTGSGNIDYLIVGGGSAGQGRQNFDAEAGGGGGGGFVKEITNYTINSGTYTVTIGAGSARETITPGESSSISTIDTASGGNGGLLSQNIGRGRSSSRPFAGGLPSVSLFPAGGGGGGDSAVGQNGSSTKGGNGGAGRLSAITGVRYGGGGGGGGARIDEIGSNGLGVDGGGSGAIKGSGGGGGSGLANRGGGGGGKQEASPNRPGFAGNGGSGIVVIRYVTP